MDSSVLLVATAGIFLLAGFVKGAIGLGLPTVSIGLLGLLMAPAQAAAILVVPSLVTNVWQALAGGSFWELVRRLWPVFAGICAGTFIGAVLLPHDDSGRATIWLGLALSLYAGLGLVNVNFKVPRRSETWLGLIMMFHTSGLNTGKVRLDTLMTGFCCACAFGAKLNVSAATHANTAANPHRDILAMTFPLSYFER